MKKEDIAKRYERYNTLLGLGLLSIDEVRKLDGRRKLTKEEIEEMEQR